MGKKMDALLRRGFKTSKFKAIVNLAISRLAVLKNQRQARCSIARSDVVQLLHIGSQERALLRVEQVIKEQNMLDAFALLEGYCHLLIERVNLIEQERVCPEELKEAISSLIYAATRCGEFPELQEIRSIFTSWFGKEFASRAIELRNNCGVNPKIIQKMSTRMPSLETKIKVLKEIASDNNIVLQMEETPVPIEEDKSQQASIPSAAAVPTISSPGDYKPTQPDSIERDEEFSNSLKLKTKYKDVADAAQAAFESAAYAAAAARAAVELSRSESTDPDDPTSPNPRPRKVSATFEPMKYNKLQNLEMEDRIEAETEMKDENFDPSEKDVLNSEERNAKEMQMSYDEEGKKKTPGGDVFDDSDGENETKSTDTSGLEGAKSLNINRRPISVRTRWAQGR